MYRFAHLLLLPFYGKVMREFRISALQRMDGIYDVCLKRRSEFCATNVRTHWCIISLGGRKKRWHLVEVSQNNICLTFHAQSCSWALKVSLTALKWRLVKYYVEIIQSVKINLLIFCVWSLLLAIYQYRLVGLQMPLMQKTIFQ
jgi:hypothetical protein